MIHRPGNPGFGFDSVKLSWIDPRAATDPVFLSWVDLRSRVLRQPLGLSFTDEELAAEREDLHLLALEGERVIAGLLVQERSQTPGVWKIRQVAVEPLRQGEGIGRALMRAVESAAREAGKTTILLHSREMVCGFYEKLGYIATGESFAEVGIPHRRMELSL